MLKQVVHIEPLGFKMLNFNYSYFNIGYFKEMDMNVKLQKLQ
jgi:hypothetical protein